MIQTCSKCKNYDISISDEPCRKCQQAFRRGEGKPNFIASITNADRIRAMTDEELAELFANDNCGYCRIHDFCFDKGCAINCEDVWLDWLKQEVVSND